MVSRFVCFDMMTQTNGKVRRNKLSLLLVFT